VQRSGEIICKHLRPPAVGPEAFGAGERRVSVSQPSPGHPTDEDLSLHPCEQRSLPAPQRVKITRYHPKKQVPLPGGPGRWEARVRGDTGKAKDVEPRLYGSFKGRAHGKSGLIGTRATRRPKKQSETVSFPPRSPKARDLLRQAQGKLSTSLSTGSGAP
jgi:hypothetical protein